MSYLSLSINRRFPFLCKIPSSAEEIRNTKPDFCVKAAHRLPQDFARASPRDFPAHLKRRLHNYFMDMTNKEYGAYVNSKSRPSPMGKNLIWAFLVGGAICTVGQALLNFYRYMGLNQNGASTAVSVTLIFLAALFTGLGWFDKLAKHAGAGTLVPITGFANAMVSPALEFRSEGLVTGTAAKLFIIAGPVLVFGISASVVYGLLLVLFTAA